MQSLSPFLCTRLLTLFPFSTFPVALIYNAVNSSIDGMRGKHDAWGSIAAGGLTGAIYKCTGLSPLIHLIQCFMR